MEKSAASSTMPRMGRWCFLTVRQYWCRSMCSSGPGASGGVSIMGKTVVMPICSEEALFYGQHVARPDHGVEVYAQGVGSRIVGLDEIQLAPRGPLLEAAGERHRLAHGKAGLVGITAGLLHFAVHVERSVFDDRDRDLGIGQ